MCDMHDYIKPRRASVLWPCTVALFVNGRSWCIMNHASCNAPDGDGLITAVQGVGHGVWLSLHVIGCMWSLAEGSTPVLDDNAGEATAVCCAIEWHHMSRRNWVEARHCFDANTERRAMAVHCRELCHHHGYLCRQVQDCMERRCKVCPLSRHLWHGWSFLWLVVPFDAVQVRVHCSTAAAFTGI